MFAQIGLRLEEERKRLGLSQDQMAGLGGVAKRTYCNYEAGSREPGAALLASLAAIGTDIQYIVTGQRQGQGIGQAAVHQAVLDAVDLLSLEKKVDAQQLAKAVTKLCAKAAPTAQPAPVSTKFVIQGNTGQNIDATQGGTFVVNMGKDKKK